MLSRVEALRASDPSVDARFVDLRYVDLVADPVASVRRVDEHIGSELSPPTEAAVATYAAANRQGKYGRHSYSFGELGLDAADLRDRFAAYRERYEIPEESVPRSRPVGPLRRRILYAIVTAPALARLLLEHPFAGTTWVSSTPPSAP